MFKTKDISKGFLSEFSYLYLKHTLIALRAPKLFFVKIFQNLLTAIIIGVLFQNVIKILTLDDKTILRYPR
jgi:hypothetical protein